MMVVNAICGKPDGEPARTKDSYESPMQAEEDGNGCPRARSVFGGEDAGEEALEGDEVRDDIAQVRGDDGDAKEG